MKKVSKVFACIAAGVSLVAASLCTGCTAGSYTEEQHIQRVTARAEERFLGEGSEYTGLEVYPIYNEYDELNYMLIELEPQGFVYVLIRDDVTFEWISGVGMYLCSELEPESWIPYRVHEGMREEVVDEDGHTTYYTDRELFRDEKASAVPKEFFTNLERQGIAAEVDINSGTAEYNESINIGDVKLLVESSDQHIGYINDSPVLSKYLKDGYLSAPLILDLKRCGNILINVSDESFDESAVALVNQLIIQFLVSFPANRINFCLIDIDNKMGFSQFKILNKINNGILLNGIIRDDRQLENTIKDMEQTMYKIDEDQLCYNNVKNIYEYNKKFEANPQSMHLFVLINYPACMRDDLAKRVLKLVQNGNKEGIYCLIVNNKSVPLAPGYKKSEYDQFIEGVGKNAVIINKSENGFEVEVGTPNKFVPKDNISVKALPGIVEMLKTNAESNRQKVIPLSLMFEDTDKKVANKKKSIPSSAEVLEIPIGARGGEVQDLLLKTTGDGSAHAVVIGGTGSGKSNLLHAIIMSACYKYSPDELNLYLVDFKGGVEFKYYEANKDRKKQLPHIKLTGLTSDLNDGVAILDNLQKELRRREDEFRTNRVEDIVQYRNLGKKMPRLFVIIDEIQELFEQDENLGRKAINIMRELFNHLKFLNMEKGYILKKISKNFNWFYYIKIWVYL